MIQLILNNSLGISIFSIAFLLLVKEIYTVILNERRRKSDKWVYLEVLRDGIVRMEKNQALSQEMMTALVELETKCNESLGMIYTVIKDQYSLSAENKEKLEILCANCIRNPNE